MKHKYISILNELPNFPKEVPFACGCNGRNVEKERRINPRIQELSKEIDKLETTFEIENGGMLKSDLTKADIKLQSITTDENLEIQILQTSLVTTEKRISALQKQIQEKFDLKNIRNTYSRDEKLNNNSFHTCTNSSVLEVKKLNINSEKSQLPFKLANQRYKENNHGFLTANNYIEKLEEQNKLDKTSSLEQKIGIVGGNIRSKKTFVFKTRSLLTQKSKH
ncbi:uncharacterized protein LOC106660354 [Trichogramma pretiosum]|uniref:uncharacterized protein LOC106660354 n=1 Tax=Trichogramma pretiosum TaxID=7493 RepID=UPI0006C9DD0E|nr:uncharacterized protein LOC106660354 [Trichogramma pretiosum]